jgi:hypothetical protein
LKVDFLELFSNITEFKEISTTYDLNRLIKEVKEIILRIGRGVFYIERLFINSQILEEFFLRNELLTK